MFHFALDAASSDAAGAQGANPLIMIAIFAFFIIIWYFLALRPQRKKEKELKAKIEKMRVGDQVITIGGLVGILRPLVSIQGLIAGNCTG